MRELASFKDIHKGETIIVCGCGSSLNELDHPGNYITIGVNDVGRKFHPDYLVVVNPRRQFVKDRFKYIETSQARYLFTQLDLGRVQPEVVRFRLGKKGGTDFSDPNVLNYTQNSPYVALCLAIHMGAKYIGIIGVDFTQNHFYAQTGRHVLAPQLARIDAGYKKLAAAAADLGVEVINLSDQSRLTAFKKGTPHTFRPGPGKKNTALTPDAIHKVFVVNYKFLSCGDVFRTGLKHAGADLDIHMAEAYWDDPHLPGKVERFKPGLLFVVHGRKFARKWKETFKKYNTAVWLLDEPYEVDDTAKFSGRFDTVFVNDPGTLDRHKNAHYLPVGYDPRVYCESAGPKKYKVGFIGGTNPVRCEMLGALADAGLLSYIVGGPWKSKKLQRLCLSGNISHEETAALYKQTGIIVNIFRSRHHFNQRQIPAVSLNPRVYEALACGALVVSQNRPELGQIFPDLPVFENKEQLVSLIRELLANQNKLDSIRQSCKEKLEGNTYAHRLKSIIDITLDKKANPAAAAITPVQDKKNHRQAVHALPSAVLEDWTRHGIVSKCGEDGTILLSKVPDQNPGSEEGLISGKAYAGTDLSFDVYIESGSSFIAKVQQVEQFDQLTNSYHLFCNSSDYFARHHHIFKYLHLDRDSWQSIRILFERGKISFFKNGSFSFFIDDPLLKKGYAFLGTKGGSVRLRNIKIKDSTAGHYLQPKWVPDEEENKEYDILMDGRTDAGTRAPIVSIITTVYDRVDCLRNCIKSVKRLQFKDYQHIIVADFPPAHILAQLRELVELERDHRMIFINLKKRYNNWGIKPASIGVRISTGKYICFLSDDNGYTPDHIGTLVGALEQDPGLGFVYSSCLYAGRLVLRHPVPRPGGIDLGQPMFRRELFSRYLQDDLPFDMMAWDWYMIERFMKNGVRWKHINRPTFLFRLHKYPRYIYR